MRLVGLLMIVDWGPMAEIKKLRRHLLHGDDSLSVFRNRLNVKVSLRANTSCITVYFLLWVMQDLHLQP